MWVGVGRCVCRSLGVFVCVLLTVYNTTESAEIAYFTNLVSFSMLLLIVITTKQQ